MNRPSNRLLLRNASVVLPDRTIEHATILVENGLIAAVRDDTTARSSDVETLDLDGLTVLPGFIDVHIHGAVGVDVMEATPKGLQQVARYLASQGVTAWLPTFVPASDENYASAVAAIAGSMSDFGASCARVLGVHYEGPFVNSAQCGALHVEHFKTYSNPADLDSLPVRADMVRMITLAPEVEGGIELVRELGRRGWVVSLGHTRASIEVLDQAAAAGACHMTHFMNAMAPLHHRSPGPIAWGLAREDVTCDIIADGIHLDPFMLRLLVKIKGVAGISLISDAIAAAGKGDGDYRIWGETISVKNGRTANASGSIAGSVINMLDAVRLMLSLGVSHVDVAEMASSNPARLLGVANECGSLEVGKRADLVALDTDGRVRLTLVAGQIAFSL
ncbi:MAG TPA: N-acetylglucosamine-6-phosphate deacetylase [Pyrinomonadaceae bacterium]|jgi:N-acetylglucosamine-6-phosphate deacetylase